MKKAVLLDFVLLLLSIAVGVGFITPIALYIEETDSLMEVTLSVHNIYSDKNFSTIQEAINDNETLDGHTILVEEGTYYEHVVVNKSLALIGEDKETTIIDGNTNGTVITVTAGNVLIRNLTIRNSGVGWYYYGIRVEASRCNIIGNVVASSLWGVDLDSSPDSTILQNNITNNTAPGVRLASSPNVTISENNITNNIGTAVLINASPNSTISRNNIAHNSGDGVVLLNSANTVVSGNKITNNGGGMKDGYGVYLSSDWVLVERNTILLNYCGLAISGGDNLLKENNISWNSAGICLVGSSSERNQIYHNNLIENENQVVLESSYPRPNVWDNGYPSGGNYWSDYFVVDVKSGVNQDQQGIDAIGDTAYVIVENNIDNYPLVGIFSGFNATSDYHVQVICNSTITDFQFNGTALCFNVTGESGTIGFCRILVPTALINGTYRVFVNATEVLHTVLPFSSATHSYLHFTYNHSTQEVTIIPEFPAWTLHLILLVFAVVTAICKRSQ